MTTYSRASAVLLKLVFVALQGLEATELMVSPEVTGYISQDVTLPCHTSKETNVSQVQWDLLQPGGNRIALVIFNSQFGQNIFNTSLKERIMISENSLTIKNVQLSDAGLYMCTLSTFPLGQIEGSTKLVVREQAPLSSGSLAVIVTTVVLLLVIVTAVLYLCVVKKYTSRIRHHVVIDTDDPAINGTRPSVIIRREEAVYSDVMIKSHKAGAPPSRKERSDASHADNVLYSEVNISAQQSR